MLKYLLFVCLLFTASSACAQEWKNLRKFRLKTGRKELVDGEWLKHDRKKNTERWQNANTYNLQLENCADKYPHFAQKRDLYRWADRTRIQKGHEVMWAGVAYMITRKMVVVDNPIVNKVFIGNRQFTHFLKESNALILKNIRPELTEICDGRPPMKGDKAIHWDSATIYKEQCLVLDTLYKKQPPRVLKKFNRIVNGKGVYRLIMPRDMRMNADITDCKNRCNYGLSTIVTYYCRHCK